MGVRNGRPGGPYTSAKVRDRYERRLVLVRMYRRLPIAELARRLGVNRRTVERYRADLRRRNSTRQEIAQ